VKALAREHTSEALDTLAKIMLDPKAPHAARVSACRELLDRGYGRPESSVNAKVETKREPDFNVLNEAERTELNRILDMAAPFFNKVLEAQGNSDGSSVN
jgi:hypothetical protein